KVAEIKSWKNQMIAVCKSGGRSEQATNFLAAQGVDAINGGPWNNVARIKNS
ncbi:MAG: rhodanese-like domain-containing protein, partial [Polaribacter sp.]|nr:rhodanese-like domain-containing protein [Polaribacter sp.]